MKYHRPKETSFISTMEHFKRDAKNSYFNQDCCGSHKALPAHMLIKYFYSNVSLQAIIGHCIPIALYLPIYRCGFKRHRQNNTNIFTAHNNYNTYHWHLLCLIKGMQSKQDSQKPHACMKTRLQCFTYFVHIYLNDSSIG